MEDVMLYIHIPFCIRKCLYCDFLSAPADRESQSLYVDALLREMELKKEIIKERRISSIFVGGGTPSALDVKDLERLLTGIKRIFAPDSECEYTIECNPGTLTKEKLLLMKEHGVNRLSIGLQSMNDDELKTLGRIHTADDFKESYLLARVVGFTNINVDIMSSLPGQDIKKFEKTLTSVTELSPEHISVYSLIIEEGTEFYNKYAKDIERRAKGEDTVYLPDEDTEYKIGKYTTEMLESLGYHRYEISNYAKQGRECRHNTGYWQRRDYLGLGLGAASLIEGTRYKNITGLYDYTNLYSNRKETPDIKSGYEDSEKLSCMDEMEETMFLGLRMVEGVNISAFEKRFGVSMQDVYKERIDSLLADELVLIDGDRLKLTDRGLDLGNYVYSMFLFD